MRIDVVSTRSDANEHIGEVSSVGGGVGPAVRPPVFFLNKNVAKVVCARAGPAFTASRPEAPAIISSPGSPLSSEAIIRLNKTCSRHTM